MSDTATFSFPAHAEHLVADSNPDTRYECKAAQTVDYEFFNCKSTTAEFLLTADVVCELERHKIPFDIVTSGYDHGGNDHYAVRYDDAGTKTEYMVSHDDTVVSIGELNEQLITGNLEAFVRSKIDRNLIPALPAEQD